jgi:pSer/pThr/pTyr-binding forkhead associated (FHA) protein
VTDASGATRRVTLGAGRHEIGRAVDCAISVDDRTLTRRHAVVTVTRDRVMLEDQDSQNGTFKSGERLTGPVSLQIGDVVTFGDQVTATVVAS